MWVRSTGRKETTTHLDGKMIRKLHFLFLLLFLTTFSGFAAGFCPQNCICADNLIICTCQGTIQQNMTLGPFHGIDFIGKIFVHSCHQLRIPPDTFAGLAMSAELSISDIRKLELYPNSFREMHKYPEQILISDSTISTIPSDAFAGVNRVRNLWFRNVSIGAIETNAFSRISEIQYLYFYNSPIKSIRHRAFSQMSDIKYMFFRGLPIDLIEDHILMASTFRQEIVFEGVKVKRMHIFALTGAESIEHLILTNSTIETTTKHAPKTPYTETGEGQLMRMIQVNFDELSLGIFSNFVKVIFDYCRIEKMRHHHIQLRRVDTLKFFRTLVNYIEKNSMEKMERISNVVFEECAIDTIHKNAFAGSHAIQYFMFLDTRFIQFQPHAFSNLTVNNWILENSHLETIHHSAFEGMHAKESIKLFGNQIGEIRRHAFTGIRAKYFGLEENVFREIRDGAFEGLFAQQTNISVNTFLTYSVRHSLKGINSADVIVTFNRFPCVCTTEYAELINTFRSENHLERGWNYENNYCLDSETNNTVSIPQFENSCGGTSNLNKDLRSMEEGGFVCEQKLFVTKCKCSDGNAVIHHNFMNSVSEYSTTLIIHSCQDVTIRPGAFSSFKHLGTLEIEANHLNVERNSFANLKELRFLLIKLAEAGRIPPRTFYNLPALESVVFHRIQIRTLAQSAFEQVTIQKLEFTESSIGYLEENYLGEGANIHNLTIYKTDFGVIETITGLGSVQNLLFTHNIAQSIRGSGSYIRQTKACFEHNSINCHCENSIFARLLEMSQPKCDFTSNLCTFKEGNTVPAHKVFAGNTTRLTKDSMYCHHLDAQYRGKANAEEKSLVVYFLLAAYITYAHVRTYVY